jgi:hypothetical protein
VESSEQHRDPAVKKEKQNGQENSEERQEAGKREAVDEGADRQALVFPTAQYGKRAAPKGAAAFFLFIQAFFGPVENFNTFGANFNTMDRSSRWKRIVEKSRTVTSARDSERIPRNSIWPPDCYYAYVSKF